MKPTDQHIDDLLRKRMEGYSEAPPPAVWDALEKRLEKKRRKGGAWIWYVFALIALLAATALIIARRVDKIPPGIHRPDTGQAKRIASSGDIREAAAIADSRSDSEDVAGMAAKRTPIKAQVPSAALSRIAVQDGQRAAGMKRGAKGAHRAPLPASDIPQSESAGNQQAGALSEEAHSGAALAAATKRIADSAGDEGKRSSLSRSQQIVLGAATSVRTHASHTAGRVSSRKGSGTQSAFRSRRDSRERALPAMQVEESKAIAVSTTAVSLTLPDDTAADQRLQDIIEVPGQLIASVPKTIVTADSSAAAQADIPLPPEKKLRRRRRTRITGGADALPQSAVNSSVQTAAQEASLSKGASSAVVTQTGQSDAHNPRRKTSEKLADSLSLSQGEAGTKSGLQALGTLSEPGKQNIPFRFRTGIYSGQERGTGAFRANKTVLDVFFEWTFRGRFGIGIAPALKWACTNQEYTRSDGSYIRAGLTERTVFNQERDSMGGYSGYASYAFVQRYDSLVASRTLGRTYRELELPVSLFFHLTKNWTLSGGLNLVWGAAPGFTGTVNTNAGLLLRDTVLRYFDTSFVGPAAASKFAHPGIDSFGAYKDPAADPLWKPFRYGYTFSLKYTHRYGLSAELSMRQQLGGLVAATDAQMKSLLRQTYFRLSLGYEFRVSKKNRGIR